MLKAHVASLNLLPISSGLTGSSMGMCSVGKTVSTEPSLFSSGEISLTRQGPSCQASSTIRPRDRKPGSRTSK